MDFLNRKAIKAEARAFIRPDRKWFYMFLAWLPIIVVNGIFQIRFNVHIDHNMSLQEIITTVSKASSMSFIGSIVSLLLIPFNIALAGYFLNHIRGFNPEWKSIYIEGKDRFGKYFEVGFVTALIIFLWGLLFIIPGIVKAYAYSQVSFIIHDNPNLSTQDARKISDLMTKGYKGQLFIKDFSFFFWYMFIGITLGFGVMYVGPYTHVTNAMYYENLKNHAIEAGIVAPEAFGIVNMPVDANGMQGYDANNQSQFTGGATFYTPNQPVNNGYQAPVNNGFEPAVPVAPVIPSPVENEAPEFTGNSASFADDSAAEKPLENEVDIAFNPSDYDNEPISFGEGLGFDASGDEDKPIILNGEEYTPDEKPFDGE